MTFEQKVEQSHNIIKKALYNSKKPLVAFSGGKDGLIVAHMLKTYVPDIKMICEISHTFKEVVEDIKKIAKQYNFNVEYKDSLNDQWLINHPEYIFASDTKIISKYCFARQQSTIKKYQKKGGYDCTFTGRTKFDNTVKAEIYNTKDNGIQAHPIRNFTDDDVWQYFKEYNLTIPLIYKTKFGEKTGNSPWFAMGYKNKNLPVYKCWEAVNEIDRSRTFEKKFSKYVTKLNA